MASKKTEEPAEFNWISLAQPTPVQDNWEPVDTKGAGDGPWWVKDGSGAQYATYVLVKGQKVLDESPFDRSGELRTPIPGGIDTAPAE